MTTIRFPFRNYPAWRRPGKAALFDGIATVELGETPRLPVAEASSKMMKVPPRPLQDPLRFAFGDIQLCGFQDVSEVRQDLETFIRGRHWPRIQCLLYAEFMREVGLPDYAAVYSQLGRV